MAQLLFLAATLLHGVRAKGVEAGQKRASPAAACFLDISALARMLRHLSRVPGELYVAAVSILSNLLRDTMLSQTAMDCQCGGSLGASDLQRHSPRALTPSQ